MFFLFCAGLGFAALLIDTVAITVAMPAASALGTVLIMLPGRAHDGVGHWHLGLRGCRGRLPADSWLLPLVCARRQNPPARAPGPPAEPSPRAIAWAPPSCCWLAIVPAAIPGFTEGHSRRVRGSIRDRVAHSWIR